MIISLDDIVEVVKKEYFDGCLKRGVYRRMPTEVALRVVDIATEYDVSPVMLVRIIFRIMSRNKCLTAFKSPVPPYNIFVGDFARRIAREQLGGSKKSSRSRGGTAQKG